MSTPLRFLKLDPDPCGVCDDVLRRAFCTLGTSFRHSYFSELQKSAENGCNLCRMIRHSILVWECGGVPDFPLGQLDELSVFLQVSFPTACYISISLGDEDGCSSIDVGFPRLSIEDSRLDRHGGQYHPSSEYTSI
jgi:hypothetical protein